MKPKSTLRSFLILASSALLAASPALHAATYYWDTNDTTAGFGAASGTWGTDAFWTTDGTGAFGVAGITSPSTTDALFFGNGADGLDGGTITVGTVDAGDMTFASGSAASGQILLSGGTITLAAAETITVDTTTNVARINSILAGAGTSFTKAGDGTLVLGGANTFTGALLVNAGALTIADYSGLGGSTPGTDGPSSVTVANNSVLNIAQVGAGVTSNTIYQDLSLNGSLNTTGGSGSNKLNLTWNGNVTLTADSSIHANGNSTITVTGAVDLGAKKFTVQTDGSNATTNIISGDISGVGGVLKKTGGNNLYLTGTGSTYSGGTEIGGGLLYARFSALGTGNLVFTGDSEFRKLYNTTTAAPTTMGITVNDGVSATMSAATFYYNATFAAPLAGNSTASLTLAMGNNTEFDFNNTSNTYQGELVINGGGTADNNTRIGVKSLGDSSSKLIINNALFRLNSGGVDLNFANRVVEIQNNARIDNDSTNSNVEITIAQNLRAAIGNNARTLILSGVNTGNNTIAGKISDSATGSGKVSVTKQEAGLWILSGANDYTGTTTISGGTLTLGVDDCLADASNVVIGNGTLNVADTVNDVVGTLDVTNAASKINLGGGTTLAFLDSSAVDWTGGALDITGTFVDGSSLRFGDGMGTGLLPAQLASITVNGGGGPFTLDGSGYLTTGGGTAYDTWATGGELFDAEANNDGVKNGMAWVVGAANPSADATGLLPTLDNTTDPTYFIYTYRRADAAGTDPNTTIAVEYGSNLSNWTTATAGPNIIITPTDNYYGVGPGVDKVEVKINRTLAVDDKLFVRLNVVKAP